MKWWHNNIQPLNQYAITASQQQWNQVAKPLHSLGLLEDAICQIAGIIGETNVLLDRRCVVVFCADNGVVEENVTQTDSSVTEIVAKSIADGTSNINCIAKTCCADVLGINIGMRCRNSIPGIRNYNISYGTNNIAKGAAMTVRQAKQALEYGTQLAGELKQNGYQILVTGEMGIGNTTTSSALASVLLHLPVEQVTGRGAGLSSTGLKKKISVIQQAVQVNQPSSDHPLELLAKLGGYEIAGMAGLFLGGAMYRIPVIIDGFISAVAAAIAAALCPAAIDYMLCSHVSKEPAGKLLLQHLKKKPLLQAELCLGEGTGGVLLLPLLDSALAVYQTAHRFSELPMEAYKPLI